MFWCARWYLMILNVGFGLKNRVSVRVLALIIAALRLGEILKGKTDVVVVDFVESQRTDALNPKIKTLAA